MVDHDLQPVAFAGADAVLKAPADWDAERHGPCHDLPTMWRDGVSVSCWAAGWRQRLLFLMKGRIVLHVAGGQPPVMLTVQWSAGNG